MKTTLMLSAGLVLALLAGGCGKKDGPPKDVESAGDPKAPAVAAKPSGGTQTNCPIMGGAIDKDVYADHAGKRVYFCCPACIAKFKKDPAKHIKRLEAAGVTFDKLPGK